MAWGDELKQEGYFYLDQRESRGNGDLLYNTFRKIIDTNDQSEWAWIAFQKCYECLKKGQRWPDSLSDRITTTNHEQYDMTQDPWILGYCCAVSLDVADMIKEARPPRFFWLPDKNAWRRALLGKRNLYWFWRRVARIIPKQGYVQEFYDYMEAAYEKRR
jgi:hypothetical protein